MKYFLSISILLICVQFAQAQENFKYNHILITNDDGIEDAKKLLALAKSVRKVSKRVSIVVSSSDKSGTSNDMTFGKNQSTLEVTCEYYDKENNISVYETPGNPADCVILGLSGLFGDDRPDLVLSGINGGANIGVGWFGSGTIGAIRTASLLGVRGIALSGFDDDDERSFTVVPNWVTKLISSELIADIDRNSYLTIGFPKTSLDAIKGVKLSTRRVSFIQPESVEFHKIYGDDSDEPDNTTIWTLKTWGNLASKEAKSDREYLEEGYIVITPMTIDENNTELLKAFEKKRDQIPEFSLND